MCFQLAHLLAEILRFGAAAVLVTGPQRSGTTLAAHVLALELGYRYVDEQDIGIDNQKLARRELEVPQTILQAPGLCHCAETFGVPVVVVRRNLAEIAASEARIGWQNVRSYELGKYGLTSGQIAAVKYLSWEQRQKATCVLPLYLDYEKLAHHPLWVPAERRRHFTPRQFTEGEQE